MRAREFLLEYNRQITAQNFGARMFDVFKKEGKANHARLALEPIGRNSDPNEVTEIINFLLEKLEQTDPTPHKEYVQWLARLYTKGGVKFEDVITQVAQGLQIFDQLKKKRLIPQPYDDINRYLNFHSFDQAVSSFKDQLPAQDKSESDRGTAKEVYRDAQLRIIQPMDQTAACYYGRGTKWCTSATTSSNMFDHYHSEGPLYIIIPKNAAYEGEKYQFHFPSAQFNNEKDQSIDVPAMVNKYPQLQKLFKNQAKQFGALKFFFRQDEINKIIELLLPRIMPSVKSYINLNRPKIAKEIVEDLIGHYPKLKSLREDMYEILSDDIENSVEYYYQAITEDAKMHPETLYNKDAFWDMSLESDALREFAAASEISSFIKDMLELDEEEESFEIDQSLNGVLYSYYFRAVQAAWKKVSEQYLKI